MSLPVSEREPRWTAVDLTIYLRVLDLNIHIAVFFPLAFLCYFVINHPTKRKQRKEEWKPQKSALPMIFWSIYLSFRKCYCYNLILNCWTEASWAIRTTFGWWYMSEKIQPVLFFLDEMVKMHWRAEQRACLTICFKFNCSVLWHKDWETQHILDSYVCPFGFVAQRPTRVAENIRVRQKRDIRRLWLKLWPIKPRCPTDPLLSPSLSPF